MRRLLLAAAAVAALALGAVDMALGQGATPETSLPSVAPLDTDTFTGIHGGAGANFTFGATAAYVGAKLFGSSSGVNAVYAPIAASLGSL